MRLIITSTPSSSPIAHVNGLRRREPEPLERARALHGEQRIVVGDVAHVGAAQLALLQPVEVGLAVRRVHDHEVAVLVEAVDDHVVDDPALARS